MSNKCKKICSTTTLLSRTYLSTFLLSSALILSLASTLDCQFLILSIGFHPINSLLPLNSTSTSVGLWTYESYNNQGYCLTYESAQKSGGIVQGDASYGRWFGNGDVYWTVVRFAAVFSLIVGFIANMSVWTLLCTTNHRYPQQSIIVYLSFLALILETIKIVLFFQISYCTSSAIFLNATSDSFEQVEGCGINRGASVAIVSVLSYFSVVVLLWRHLNVCGKCCKAKHTDEDYLDNVSLPTFLKSIGESVSTTSRNKASRRNSSMIPQAPKDHSDASTLTMTHALGLPGSGKPRDLSDVTSAITWETPKTYELNK